MKKKIIWIQIVVLAAVMTLILIDFETCDINGESDEVPFSNDYVGLMGASVGEINISGTTGRSARNIIIGENYTYSVERRGIVESKGTVKIKADGTMEFLTEGGVLWRAIMNDDGSFEVCTDTGIQTDNNYRIPGRFFEAKKSAAELAALSLDGIWVNPNSFLVKDTQGKYVTMDNSRVFEGNKFTFPFLKWNNGSPLAGTFSKTDKQITFTYDTPVNWWDQSNGQVTAITGYTQNYSAIGSICLSFHKNEDDPGPKNLEHGHVLRLNTEYKHGFDGTWVSKDSPWTITILNNIWVIAPTAKIIEADTGRQAGQFRSIDGSHANGFITVSGNKITFTETNGYGEFDGIVVNDTFKIEVYGMIEVEVTSSSGVVKGHEMYDLVVLFNGTYERTELYQ